MWKNTFFFPLLTDCTLFRFPNQTFGSFVIWLIPTKCQTNELGHIRESHKNEAAYKIEPKRKLRLKHKASSVITQS